MDLSQNDLEEKVAVITGSGRGIGKELAIALAWLGAKVVIAEITDTGKNVEDIIRSEGGDALYVKTDVSDERSMENLSKIVHDIHGQVDILVNNAITFTFGSILDQPYENWKTVFDVNLKGAILGIKHFLPGMLERKYGIIITITSDEGTAYFAPYSASKAALRSLGYSLAGELADNSGVYSFVFEPGMVDTPGGKEAFSKLAPYYNLKFEEFVKLGSIGGVEGLLPVEYSSAGFAHAIVHAKNHHGQITDPFRPLGKYGLLLGSSESEPISSISIESVINILESAKAVKKVLEAVNKETEELNFFAKKWVLRVYNKRTSLSIKEWLDIINDLIEILQEKRIEALRKKSSWLFSLLKKLENHFELTKEDAKGYIKDAEKLKEAIEVIESRRKAVHTLIELLK
jgi:NAD(P)-dependent dehydrogenase (short-subunit alcohol dehydrogenase family)